MLLEYRVNISSIWKSADIFCEHSEESGNICLAFATARKYFASIYKNAENFASFLKSAEIFCELLEERGNIVRAFARARKYFARKLGKIRIMQS